MFKPGDIDEQGREIEQDGGVTWEIEIPPTSKDSVACDICGKEINRFDAVVLSTGRKRVVMCPECYKAGSSRVDRQWIERADKLKRRRNENR